nr:hypothetical protein [Pseudomonadota bacterium]
STADIGTAANRVNANATTKLSLTTGGATGAGDIFLASTVVPRTSLEVFTLIGSQTVNLDFDLSVAVVIPSTFSIADADDTVVLDITTSATDGIDLATAINLNTTTTTTSTLILTATAGSITGAETLSADSITLSAVGIGTAAVPVRLNAGTGTGTRISLTTTGANTADNTAGNIYISQATPPTNFDLTTNTGSGQTVQILELVTSNLTFTGLPTGLPTVPSGDSLITGYDVTGNITLNSAVSITAGTIRLNATGNISGNGALTAPILNLSAGGNLTATGALTAPVITLTAARIGTGTGDRVNANASDSLSLTTTGALAAGNIYLASNGSPGLSGVLPSMSLEVSTDPTSGQTVDLDFDLGAAATIPATLTIANAGDTVTLDITTTTGGIVLANAINLNPTTTVSTLMLTAAAGISGAGAVSADTITLTANGGAIVSTGNYTANSITLTASTGINTNNGVFNGTNSIGLTANGGNIASNGAFTAGSITFMASTGINTGAGVYSATNSIGLTATTGNIRGTGAYTATSATSAITLTATTGNITSTGLLTAPTVTLTGAAIGTGTGGRVNVNASGSLSLTSSGVGTAGGIFINGSSLPTSAPTVTTHPDSIQTVDLSFTQATGNIALPNIGLQVADATTISIIATAGNITGGS